MLRIALLLAVVLAAPARAGSLTVVTNNTENMPEMTQAWKDAGCEGDWRYLPGWLKDQGRTPDVVLLQQIPSLAKANEYRDELERRFPGADYSATVAEETPHNKLKANECKGNRSFGYYQTNAIIWRRDRLTAQAPAAAPAAPYYPCRAGAKTVCFQSVYASPGCRSENTQARTINAALRFKDSDGRFVSVASLHWGSGNVGNQQGDKAGWNRCAKENARRATRAVRPSDLQVFGGDLNLRGEPGNGFDDYIRKSLHFADIGQSLGATGTSDARRDFIFARNAAKQPVGGSGSTVVPWTGSVHYSDHRAIVTTLSY